RLRANIARTTEVVPSLEDALAGRNPALRSQVLQVLQQCGQAAKRAAPAVARLLGSSDQQVRQTAFFTLSSIGGPPKEAVPDLIEALRVSDQQTRYQIVNLFSTLGPAAKDAARALKKLVADGSGDVGLHALRVLLRIS